MNAVADTIIRDSIDALRSFCQEWGITELALFGSVLRSDFRPDSDIDVLVQFRDEVRYSLFDQVRMSAQLEQVFGRPVDLIDRKAIEQSANYLRRDLILHAAEVVYAER
ncbi:nucleotidyltransferase family protein [Candidatus Chloroploca sp. Khr17]|uniref:nucleotidyltransferase family protein n=1 Tax=Candidatus Chloroploca sp. Khr17 TaxID=2496869 RepID=UPI00101D431D|nr:nucleotidyltransferase domain-containing protein [Candidatus Chloroploca sp. Khr17]NCC35079.1 nucleotidyltransferase [Chloroflexia bacterium]